MAGISKASGFNTSDNQFFTSRLPALVHQQKLDLRAIIQSDTKYGTKTHLTSTEIADLLERQGEAITKTNAQYKKMINNERKKTPVIN